MTLKDLNPEQDADLERSIIASLAAAQERYGLDLGAIVILIDASGTRAKIISNIIDPGLRHDVLVDASKVTGNPSREYP